MNSIAEIIPHAERVGRLQAIADDVRKANSRKSTPTSSSALTGGT